MTRLLPERKSEDIKFLKEYWAVRKRYDLIFGEYDSNARGACPMADRIKEMQDKLDDYYRQQRTPQTEKREPEMAHA